MHAGKSLSAAATIDSSDAESARVRPGRASRRHRARSYFAPQAPPSPAQEPDFASLLDEIDRGWD